MHPQDDDSLAVRSRKGDPLALAQLYRRHAGSLLVYLRRYLGERADAEDVLQETFVRIFEGRGRYNRKGTFRAWLYTIATRLAADRVRQKTRRAALLTEKLGPEALQVTSANPLKRAEENEMLEHIHIVLADLPPEYATAFHLRVREGFSYREMATISQSPTGTLRSRVHHTIKRIRDALAILETNLRTDPPAPPMSRGESANETEASDRRTPD